MILPALQVRLMPSLKRDPAPASMPVLDERGPRVTVGGARGDDNLAIPVRPDASTLFGPRGACLVAAQGPLWVSDTGHHRLLGWALAPARDDMPADWVIGQSDFAREGRNAKGPADATTLNVPTGICPLGGGLAVADAWNHRVLIWRRCPTLVPAAVARIHRSWSASSCSGRALVNPPLRCNQVRRTRYPRVR